MSDSHGAPLKYQFKTLGELIAEAPPSTGEEEESYRRGYAQGYWAAIEDLKEVKQQGYTRIRELENFLYKHWLRITYWRFNRLTAGYFPPQMPEPQNWPALRRQVLSRDSHQCVWCGSLTDLQVDHIDPVKEGGVAEEDNLRTLCRPCNLSRNSEGIA